MLRTILYTREHSCPEAIKEKFLKNNLLVIEIPLISTVPLKHKCPKGEIDWVFFTSENTLKYLDKSFDLSGYKIASIGNKTTKKLIEKGISVDFQPSRAVAETFAAEWAAEQRDKQKVFLPNSALARTVLVDELSLLGHEIFVEAVYTSLFSQQSKEELKKLFQDSKAQDVMLSSPSIWHHFLETANECNCDLHQWRLFSIGPVTSKTIEKSGYKVYKEASVYDMDHLYEVVLKEFE